MTSLKKRCLLALAPLALGACAESSVSTLDSGGTDTGADVADTIDDATDTADTGADVATDADAATDGSGDTSGGGGFGAPCTDGSACFSGICIDGADDEPICTIPCLDSCPDERYECALIQNAGGDLVQVCFPILDELCRPCVDNRDCSGLANRCVDLLDGRFCGVDCSDGGVCPNGYVCSDLLDGSQQCVPEAGQCTGCSDGDFDLHGVGPTCLGEDCDDANASIYDGAAELCDGVDNDCDFLVDEEFDFNTDVNHCGGCNMPCEVPNAVPDCDGAACFVRSCLEGYFDRNGDPADGCEYFCEFETEGEDVPDLDFRDTNCDGIDGDPNNAIFVSPSGDDTNPGTRALPMRTVEAAMQRARDDGFAAVYVAEGEYTGAPLGGGNYEPIRLLNDIDVYGAYDATTWRRSSDNLTKFLGSNPAVLAIGVNDRTLVGGVVIEGRAAARNADGSGGTAFGMQVDSSNGLVLQGVTIRAGDGSSGANGSTGDSGGTGSDGGRGGDGRVSGSGVCPSNPAPSVGSPGSSPCGRTGGVGGGAGRGEDSGGTGGTGAGGSSGGSGGRGGGNDWINAPDRDGEPGTNGDPGSGGSTGGGGAAGSAEGSLAGRIWVSGPGGRGENGGNGNGGGGGGGGGGATGNCPGLVDSICDGWGAAGGGGGGGGCGGVGGTGGLAGGGSFGLYVLSSSIVIERSTISGGNGGPGGDGGSGGAGGRGGSGGPGGDRACNGGRGGNGGAGGGGGNGGRGGGGAGGNSYALITVGSTVDLSGTSMLAGVPGPGGAGGNAGQTGVSGESRAF